MNTYIENALQTYCDSSQTFIARQIAYNALTNAGFTEEDLEEALKKGPKDIPLTFFAA